MRGMHYFCHVLDTSTRSITQTKYEQTHHKWLKSFGKIHKWENWIPHILPKQCCNAMQRLFVLNTQFVHEFNCFVQILCICCPSVCIIWTIHSIPAHYLCPEVISHCYWNIGNIYSYSYRNPVINVLKWITQLNRISVVH